MADFVEVQVLVEGGKASGGPPLAPAIGPLGVPVKTVVDTINEKTREFKGLKVPVIVRVNPKDKSFEVIVSTPMASALIFKELGIPKGSGTPTENFVGDLSMAQVIKIAKMKKDSLNALSLKTAVKTIVGTAQSSGVKIEGKAAPTVLKEIDDGRYDDQLNSEDF